MKGSKRAKAAPLAARRAYPRLTLDDRRGIERGLDGGESMREIARMLGRPPSTVTREVRRNRVYLRPGGMEGERFPAEGPDGPCGLLARSPGGVQRVQEEGLRVLEDPEGRLPRGEGARARRRGAPGGAQGRRRDRGGDGDEARGHTVGPRPRPCARWAPCARCSGRTACAGCSPSCSPTTAPSSPTRPASPPLSASARARRGCSAATRCLRPEGRVRARPRRDQEAAAEGPREIVRLAGAGRPRAADGPGELRAEGLARLHVPLADAAGGLRGRRPGAPRRARHRGPGPLGARPDARVHRASPGREGGTGRWPGRRRSTHRPRGDPLR